MESRLAIRACRWSKSSNCFFFNGIGDNVDTAGTAAPLNAVETIAPKSNPNKLAEAKKTSSGCIDFFFILSLLTVGTVGCTIVTALLIGLPIAMIVIGAIHRNNCPASPHIAIWLIEWGTLTLARKCAFLLTTAKTDQMNPEEVMASKGLYSTLDLLIGWWPLIGGILVFEIYEPDYENKYSDNYCHYTLYRFSFVFVIVAIISLIFTACIKLYKFVKMCIAQKRNEDKKESKPADAEAGGIELNES